MRILIFLPGVGFGGAEKIAMETAKLYAESGHSVFLAFDHQKISPHLLKTCHVVKNIHLINAKIATNNYFKNNKINNAALIFNTIKTIVKVKADLIVVHLPFFNVGHQIIYAATKLKKKVIAIYHSAGEKFLPNKVYSNLVKKYLNKQLFLLAVSENNRRNIAVSFKLQVNQILKVYNAIYWGGEYQKIDRGKKQLLNNYGVNDGNIVFITVARLHRDKGFYEIIYAAAKLIKLYPEIRFIWIGEGDEKNKLQETITRYHLDEYFLLPGFQNNVEDFLIESDFFLFPTHYEGLSLSILEAVAKKIPIILSDASSNTEIITDMETGLVFKTYDSCDLYDKILWALKNKNAMNEMAEKAFYRSKSIFNIDNMVNEQLKIFNEVMQKEI